MPTISVIIPTHNRLTTLPRAVDSVLNQSFKDFELIVVDDGSTDETAAWLKQQSVVKTISQENLGVSAARNAGIREACGEWLAFLDSDDEWLPHKLATQIEFAAKKPAIKVIHGEEIWIRNGQRVNPRKKHQKFGGRIFLNCLPLCLISPSAVMIGRSVLDDVGLFDTDFVVCEDYDLWLRITSKYEVGFIEDPIIKKYGGHEDQLSRRYFAMDYWRVKSLAAISDSPDISEEERLAVFMEIRKKSEILLAGYKKHGNLRNYDEIYSLSQRAQAFSAAHND